jgi:hypothetical protein
MREAEPEVLPLADAVDSDFVRSRMKVPASSWNASVELGELEFGLIVMYAQISS